MQTCWPSVFSLLCLCAHCHPDAHEPTTDSAGVAEPDVSPGAQAGPAVSNGTQGESLPTGSVQSPTGPTGEIVTEGPAHVVDACASFAQANSAITCGQSSGLGVCTCLVSATRREFILSAPPVQSDSPLDVVYMFHGYSWSAQSFRQAYGGLEQRAQRATWFVYPTGSRIPNPAGDGSLANGWLIDPNGVDVALIDTLDAALSEQHTIERRFALGRSYGGFFAHGLVCARPLLLSGIATLVSSIIPGQPGSDALSSCDTGMPAWFGYNSDDATMNPAWRRATIESYRVRNGCTGASQQGSITRYTGCLFDTESVQSTGNHVPSDALNNAAMDFLFAL